ncbi:MAG: SusD/RagB family nutrient-binding outer membrane lipoprotein, partial [Sphingobacteriaceae bacterium]
VKESYLFLNASTIETITTVTDAVPPATAKTTTVNTNTITPANTYERWYANQSNNPNVNWARATNKLALIAYQKYIGLSGVDEMEIWTDYRRNGAAFYPFITLSQYPGRTYNSIPIRLLYPQNEILYNSDNVPSAGRKTNDQFSVKIWWMP